MTTLDGEPIEDILGTDDTSAVIVKYTFFGDATMDGQITGADVQRWAVGDFNYDHQITGADVQILLFAWNNHLGETLEAGTPVPVALPSIRSAVASPVGVEARLASAAPAGLDAPAAPGMAPASSDSGGELNRAAAAGDGLDGAPAGAGSPVVQAASLRLAGEAAIDAASIAPVDDSGLEPAAFPDGPATPWTPSAADTSAAAADAAADAAGLEEPVDLLAGPALDVLK